jgi:hypothetical protein
MKIERKRPMIPRQKFVGYLLVCTVGTKELKDNWLPLEEVTKSFKTTKWEVLRKYNLYREVINNKGIYFDENCKEFYYH